jgi:hypothetical protein
MKIEEGLHLPGDIVEIPDSNRDDFAKFLYDNGFIIGAEIGVNKGEYGQILCAAGLTMYGIDCWENYVGYKRTGQYVSKYEEAIENLKGLNYTIIKQYSADALDAFDDGSLDFVYIDANHTLPYICQDIFGWERKVRRGGIIAGHDYATIAGFGEKDDPKVFDGCHVKIGVHACMEVMHIKKLYVLGAREKDERKRDKWRTWFFFRP